MLADKPVRFPVTLVVVVPVTLLGVALKLLPRLVVVPHSKVTVVVALLAFTCPFRVALLVEIAEAASVVAVGAVPPPEPPMKSKVTVLVEVFSAMLVMGLAVLAPAHDFMLGVVASVNDVLLLEPGHGHPVLLMLPYELGVLPGLVVALAQTGYIFWG